MNAVGLNAVVIRGRAHKFGDNINTDIISPVKYMDLSPEAMSEHAMEAIDPGFAAKVKPGDILVAGQNFGSGSSRETAPLSLKHTGISAVVAVFFARIFYRNAINLGLPALELAESESVRDGDDLEIRLLDGWIHNHTQNRQYAFSPMPLKLLQMIQAGGLAAQLEQRLHIDKIK
ncbi:MAG: 3-isopropylmalate dehydratase [Peptococcaceae bacterium]|nr:3-isopropylmalate dehydratase [Peptococcaceae bacterium]